MVTAPCPCGSGAVPLLLSRTPASWKRTQGSPLSRPKRSWRPPPSVGPSLGSIWWKGVWCRAASALRTSWYSDRVSCADGAHPARIFLDLARVRRACHADSTFLAGVSDAVSTRMRCEASSYTKRLRAKFASEAFICENERASHAKHSCRLPRRGGVFL